MKNIAILAFLIASTPALGDTAYDECMKNSDETNASWNICGIEAVKRAEEALKISIKKLDKINPEYYSEAISNIREEQKAWDQYMSKACQVYGIHEVGRMHNVLSYHSCKRKLIVDRVDSLNSYIDEFGSK